MTRAAVLSTFALLLLASPAGAADPAFTLGPDGEADAPFLSGVLAGQPCPGDFDGDGNVDAAYPFDQNGAGTDGIVVQRGDGTGHLGTPATVVPVPESVYGPPPTCAAGDWNGDGRDDIAAVNAANGTLTIALGRGDGGFDSTPIPAGAESTTVAAGDINGDGRLDLVKATIDSTAIVPFVGNGAGGFTAGARLDIAPPFDSVARSMVVRDFTNDGRADVAVTVDGHNLQTATGQADGSLQGNGSTTQSQAVGGIELALGDFDGDGPVDVATDSATKFLVTRGNNGNFTTAAGTYPAGAGLPAATASLAAGDFNGDGVLDMGIGVNQAAGQPARAFIDAGRTDPAPRTPPLFQDNAIGPIQVTAGQGRVEALATADMNNDGRLDLLATTSNGSAAIAVLLNVTPTPSAVTGAASPVADTSAQIRGTIGPSNLSTQYGVDLIGAGGTVDRKPAAGTLSGTGTQDVTIALSGLTPETDYRYRVYASNANGTTVGRTRTLRTATTPQGGGQQPPPGGNGQQPPPGGNGQQPPPGGNGGNTDVAPKNSARPRILGRAQVGQALSCTPGQWNAGGRFTYAWLRGARRVRGANRPAYVVRRGDRGKRLRCRVTLTNKLGSASATSGAKRARRR